MTSEVNLIQDKTAGDLYDFVQASAWRGVISESLSAHLRAAIKKIFLATAEPGEFWRDLPLVLDISARIAKLRAANSGECSEKTIEAYRRRYDRSLRLYIEHSGNPSAPRVLSPPAMTSPSAPPPISAANRISPTLPTSPGPSASAELLAVQKVLEASLKFQQEVLAALALVTEQKGVPPPPV